MTAKILTVKVTVYHTHSLVIQLRIVHAQYVTAITNPKVEKNILSIQEAEKFRLNDFKALQQGLKSKSYSRLPQEIEACKILTTCLKKYKDLSRLSFEEVKQDHIKSALKTLDLSNLIDTLKSSQASFQSAYGKRLRNQLNHQTYDLQSINKELMAHYINRLLQCHVSYW